VRHCARADALDPAAMVLAGSDTLIGGLNDGYLGGGVWRRSRRAAGGTRAPGQRRPKSSTEPVGYMRFVCCQRLGSRLPGYEVGASAVDRCFSQLNVTFDQTI